MGAADRMFSDMEKASSLNAAEMEKVRRELAAELRAIARGGGDALQALRMGAARVLVPTRANTATARVTSERVRQRFTSWKLSFLDTKGVAEMVAGPLSGVPVGSFVRQSKRLARNARAFLERARMLEPSLSQEVDDTLAQIEDAQNDLLKLEIRSFTNVRENLLRVAGGRMTRAQAGKSIDYFDINRSIWNLSVLAHPEAVARSLLAAASDLTAEKSTSSTTTNPKRAWVVVGAGPVSVSKMTPDSRVAKILWRMFEQADLDKLYAAHNAGRQSATSWRTLGLDYGTPEFYAPVPPAIVDEVKDAMREKRSEFLRKIQEQGEREGAPKEEEL